MTCSIADRIKCITWGTSAGTLIQQNDRLKIAPGYNSNTGGCGAQAITVEYDVSDHKPLKVTVRYF